MCKRYSGTTSRHPRSPISYPTSRACNLKYGHASKDSRVHSDMSKISITLPTMVSSAFRRPCHVYQHLQCLLLGSNWLDGSNDASDHGSFPAKAHPLQRDYNNELLRSCLDLNFSSRDIGIPRRPLYDEGRAAQRPIVRAATTLGTIVHQMDQVEIGAGVGISALHVPGLLVGR